jgi:anti-anti-sigma regulatory factor
MVDLSQVEFVDSFILNTLLAGDQFASQRGRRLTLQVGTAASVATLLELTRFCDYMPCASSREEAIRLARSAGAEP